MLTGMKMRGIKGMTRGLNPEEESNDEGSSEIHATLGESDNGIKSNEEREQVVEKGIQGGKNTG